MSANVIFPKQFNASIAHRGRPLAHDRTVQLYCTLMSLYQSCYISAQSQHQISQFMIQNGEGMDAKNTLIAASAISKNAQMMDKFQQCIQEMMKFLMVEAMVDLTEVFKIPDEGQIQPTDQPPVA